MSKLQMLLDLSVLITELVTDGLKKHIQDVI